ncbi:nuclear transport factor 2 family protein [Streptomyces sp. NPDC001833]|uniref:nuclear transport factor 2 family protein n=1 Tax=Streptomyces sp. NPDC001833 TaxID=3154658 RepID=UPI00332673E1
MTDQTETAQKTSPWSARKFGKKATAALVIVGAAAAAIAVSGQSATAHDRSRHPAAPASSPLSHTTAAQVQRLSDIQDIQQLKARYFRFIDTKQWNSLAALFTAHPTINVGAKYTSGKELAEKTAAVLGTAPSAHQGFLPEITVNGNTAVGTWAMEDYLSFPPGSSYKNGLHGYGEYHDTYRKLNGKWYISSSVLTRFRVDNVPNWTPPAAAKP